MKPTLKAPGPTPLKLSYDGPLSNFSFNFDLRRYSMVWLQQAADAGHENAKRMTRA